MEKDKLSPMAAITLAQRLKACGHPVRLRLLCAIESKAPCVNELGECLGVSQPVISQHLAVLKEAGIVSSRASGNRRIYRICDPFVKALLRACLTSTTARCS